MAAYMSLPGGQIKRLRAAAHRLKLKPVVIIGQAGLTENLQLEIANALNHHELIKLRVPALPKSDKRSFATQLCELHRATLIASIGNVIVIYRRNKDKDRFAAVVGGSADAAQSYL